MATVRKSTTSTKTVKAVKAPRDWASIIVKVIMLLGLLAVGVSLGVISYRHGIKVALDHGQDRWTARLLPMGVDGGLLVSAAAMIAPRTRAATRGMARITFGVCLAATVAMNGLAVGADAGVISMAISALPGALFVLVIETALRLIRDMTRKTTERDTLGPVAKLGLWIRKYRQAVKRRQRAAERATQPRQPRPVPTEVIPATAHVAAASRRRNAAAA